MTVSLKANTLRNDHVGAIAPSPVTVTVEDDDPPPVILTIRDDD